MRNPKYLWKISLLAVVLALIVGMWSTAHAAAFAKSPPVKVLFEEQIIVLSIYIPTTKKQQPRFIGVSFLIYDDQGNLLIESKPISVKEGEGAEFELDQAHLIGSMFIIGEIATDERLIKASRYPVSMQLINKITGKTELLVSPGMIWGPL